MNPFKQKSQPTGVAGLVSQIGPKQMVRTGLGAGAGLLALAIASATAGAVRRKVEDD